MQDNASARTWRTVARGLLPQAACMGAVLVYAAWMHDRALRVLPTQLLTELPLVLHAYALLHLPLRPSRLKALIAALPIAWYYGLHDAFLSRWGDVPSSSDVVLVTDLFEVLGPLRGALVTFLLALPLLSWLAMVDWRLRWPRKTTWIALAPPLLFIVCCLIAPVRSYEAVNAITEESSWSDRRTAEDWGRTYALVLREARRGSFLAGLARFTPLTRSPLRVAPAELAALERRNVHIVIMESFVDLRALRRATFSEPPFDQALAAWVDPYVSTSISPVFGGETARAEFEVLCGVPSMRLYGVEFLGFSGARTYCLPSILREAGYRTVLSFPHGPVFFNTRRAYPGLGFEQVIFGDRFARRFEESIAMGDQDYLEDGDLFPQNLAKVRALLRQGRPFLNYVMTIYGHWPFDLDTTRHAPRIRVSPDEEDVRKIADQMLLRTEALHAYLRELVALDPHSIVVLVADHLPSLPGGTDDFVRLGYREREGASREERARAPYETFLLVFVDGKPVKLPTMRHFDLPHWVLDQLSQGAYCRSHACDFGRWPVDRKQHLDAYETILGLAAQDVDTKADGSAAAELP